MPSAARELPEGYWEPVVTENTQSANTCGVDNGAGVHTETTEDSGGQQGYR